MADANKFYTEGGMPSNMQVCGVLLSDVVATAADTIGIGSYPLFNLTANQVVVKMGYTVNVAESVNATATIAIGDGTDVDKYLTAETIATTKIVAMDTLPSLGAAESITLTVAVAALGDAEVTLWAIVADVNSPMTHTAIDTIAP